MRPVGRVVEQRPAVVLAREDDGSLVARAGGSHERVGVRGVRQAVVASRQDDQRRLQPRHRADRVQVGELELAREADDPVDVPQVRPVRQFRRSAVGRAHQEDLVGPLRLRLVDGCLDVGPDAEALRPVDRGAPEAAEVDRHGAEAVIGQQLHRRQPAAEIGRRLVQEDDRLLTVAGRRRVEPDAIRGAQPDGPRMEPGRQVAALGCERGPGSCRRLASAAPATGEQQEGDAEQRECDRSSHGANASGGAVDAILRRCASSWSARVASAPRWRPSRVAALSSTSHVRRLRPRSGRARRRGRRRRPVRRRTVDASDAVSVAALRREVRRRRRPERLRPALQPADLRRRLRGRRHLPRHGDAPLAPAPRAAVRADRA